MAVKQTLNLTQSGQSVANNTTQVRILWQSTQTSGSYNNYTRTAKYYISINGGAETEYSLSYTLPKGTTATILDTTITVPHNADGTGSIKVRTWMDTDISAGVVEQTKTLTLTTIPRASSLTASNGTLGTAQTLTINRAVSTFKHRLTYKCGDVSGYIAGSSTGYTTGTSISWTPPIGLSAENTNGTSVLVTLTLYTYTSDGTHVGTTEKTITCVIPVSVAPSCSISVKDTTGSIEKYGAAVQGVSKLEIEVSATTSQSAPISFYEISANGSKYNTSKATTEALTTPGANKIAATVKDTRGRTGSNSATVDVLEYNTPHVPLLTVHRCDTDGTENDQGAYVKIIFSATIVPLNNKNSAVMIMRYKKTTDSTFTELGRVSNVYSAKNREYTFAADSNSSYDVEVEAVDDHGKYIRATTVSTAFTLMNWNKEGNGMGIGKVSEKENTLEVGLDSDFYGEVWGKVYGLGELPGIPQGSNLNDYLTPGVYSVRQNSDAETMQNIPTKKAGRLIVSSSLGQKITETATWRYIEQRFIPYDYGVGAYDSFAWVRHINQSGKDTFTYNAWINEALKTYPVGSIHIRYDTKNPADIFGGTWTQITARVLRAGSAGSIGAEGGLADGSARTYIDVAVWRRTA